MYFYFSAQKGRFLLCTFSCYRNVETGKKGIGWVFFSKKHAVIRFLFLSLHTMVEVLMINAQGVMISVQGQDYFLSYNRVPWMQDAPIRSVLNVKMSGPEAIMWPDLDVDLEIDSLRHPERYPLVIKRNPLDYIG